MAELHQRVRHLTLVIGFALLAVGCRGSRQLSDPTLVLKTTGGEELGVSTEYGVVFLGRSARSGYLDVSAWFGDGMHIESTVIEPIGEGLYTAETEIRLPSVLMTFDTPRPGDSVVVRGRRRGSAWETSAVVASNSRARGILLSKRGIRDDPTQVGAGVFTG